MRERRQERQCSDRSTCRARSVVLAFLCSFLPPQPAQCPVARQYGLRVPNVIPYPGSPPPAGTVAQAGEKRIGDCRPVHCKLAADLPSSP